MKKQQGEGKSSVPQHIAIIMDGNRRWARKHGLPLLEGHKKGAEQFKKIAEACQKLGVKILTVYAFSNENKGRSKKEVDYLMNLLNEFLNKERGFFNKNNIRVNIMGERNIIPKHLKNTVEKINEETKNNKSGILNLALGYGGRQEILQAAKKAIKAKLDPTKLTEKIFESFLYTAGQPNPDLLIRTSGEQRLSGFLPWQCVYSELLFSKKLWPDFTEADLKKAIQEYQGRQRRFGK
jgi:undecaprenyl diphosphate synthase